MTKRNNFIAFICFGIIAIGLVGFVNCSKVSTINFENRFKRNIDEEEEIGSINGSKVESNHRYPVAVVNWDRVASPFIISIWIIFAGLAKIGFHLIHKYVSRVPESCILICLGLVVGGIAYTIDRNSRIEQLLFNPDTFFLFILPPIVMEAGYFMPKEPFFENLGTILTYAIVGTIFNAFAIGLSLYGVFLAGWMPGLMNLTILQCLLFGSIISAVDPVAVISVFEEIHVNTVLYICVFGESLLNDGVAVVLFKTFEGYIEIGESNIIAIDIFSAILSFFIVAFGGLFIGLIYGYLGSFITKYTVHNRIVEPTFVFVMCYLAYLTAEIFHLSGIIAIVFAAFTMSSYVEHNISAKSHTTVKYGMKMLANIAETIIFMLLGISAVSDFWQYWNTGFVLWTLLFITIYRAIGVVSLTFVINYIRLDPISKVDQFVMAYGGLRGAIAFSLVSLTSPELVPNIKTMICSAIVAILFTSFFQGSTIRPIVEMLHVKTQTKHKKTMFEDVNLRLIDHLMAGVEDVIGHHGHHYWMTRIQKFNTEYLNRWFIRNASKCRDHEILETFHRINKRDAQDFVQEFERGNSSSGELHSGTFANLFMPYEMRKSNSQASFSKVMRDHDANNTIIDMKSFALQNQTNEALRTVEDTDIHHLLQQNMYKTRAREQTRHRRGNIDDDNLRKKQEQEIIIRHRINLRKLHHKKNHHKSKHNRHRARSNSPLTKEKRSNTASRNNLLPSESTRLLPTPGYMVSQNSEETAINGGSVRDDEDAITFSAGGDKEIPTEETVVTETDGSVAIDRELPWKHSQDEAAVSDPHNAPASKKSNDDLWPHKDATVDESDSNGNNNNFTPADSQWLNMEEDTV